MKMRADPAQYLPAQSHIFHFVLAPQTHRLSPALCPLHGFWSGKKRTSKWNLEKILVLHQEKPNKWTKPPSTRCRARAMTAKAQHAAFPPLRSSHRHLLGESSPSLPVFCVTTPHFLHLYLAFPRSCLHILSQCTPPALHFSYWCARLESMKDFVPWEKCLVCKRCSKSICSESSSSSASTLTHCSLAVYY